MIVFSERLVIIHQAESKKVQVIIASHLIVGKTLPDAVPPLERVFNGFYISSILHIILVKMLSEGDISQDAYKKTIEMAE